MSTDTDPAVFAAKSTGAATRNLVVAVDTSLEDSEIEKMFSVLAENHRIGDTIYVLHCTGKHDGNIGGHCRAAQEKEEAEARAWIKDKFESKMNDLGYTYKVEIQHASVDTEGIGNIISKRADALGASLVVMGRSHHNFLEKIFVGSVTEWVQKHSGAPVAAVPKH